MSLPASFQNAPHLRSYVCVDYELRITRRCLRDDLERDPDTPFDQLLGQDIIKGFVGKRCQDPAGEAFTGHGTGLELHKLRYGDDHRGATWFDADNGVVWLLAYGRHRSGDPTDAYPYMEELGRLGQLLPDEDDYEALFDDRGIRAAEVAPAQAAELLDAARREAGVEQRGVLGAEVEAAEVGVVVEVVETLEEIAVAFSLDQVPAGWVTLIPAWFVPESSWDQWLQTSDHPTRTLGEGEVCWRYVKP